MRRQCCQPALQGAHLRGLQGVLQENRSEQLDICLSGKQKLPCGQASKEPLSVLPLPEVPAGGHGEAGSEDGQPQGPEGPFALKTPEKPGCAFDQRSGEGRSGGPTKRGKL